MYKEFARHKVVSDCTITEVYNDGNNGDRYFKVKILGCDNFKFTSKNLKAQQLFEKTIEKVREIKEFIKNDVNALDSLQKTYELK
jgi:hypothetical protein